MVPAFDTLRHVLVAGSIVLTVAGTALGQAAPVGPTAGVTTAREPLDGIRLPVIQQRWTGDFEAVLERRMIRFAVPYSRTLYFIDKGRELGVSAELIRGFETWLNHKYAKRLGKRPLTLFVIPTERETLLPKLVEGLADVAVGDLTVTPERLLRADFVAPPDTPANVEVVVTGPASPRLTSLDDLAGKTVHVRRGSSYYDSLLTHNARLLATGQPAATLVLVPEALEDEDMMEMVNAGLLEMIVVDEWKARIWAQVLPATAVRSDLVLRAAGRAGWAIRKGSPQLAAELEDYYAKSARREGVIPYEHLAYMKTIRQLDGVGGGEARRRFDGLLVHFRKYGAQYGFDPLMLAAQGYQESTLDQSKRSATGAIGVMQVMPATAATLNVGDITVTEANIHAGAKYLDQIIALHFQDAQFDAANRALFAFASYNAGPAAIQKLRRDAQQRGLDPNRWFGHVELVAADSLGIVTPTYVRNIYKYYVAYRLAAEVELAASHLRQDVTGTAPPGRAGTSP